MKTPFGSPFVPVAYRYSIDVLLKVHTASEFQNEKMKILKSFIWSRYKNTHQSSQQTKVIEEKEISSVKSKDRSVIFLEFLLGSVVFWLDLYENLFILEFCFKEVKYILAAATNNTSQSTKPWSQNYFLYSYFDFYSN